MSAVWFGIYVHIIMDYYKQSLIKELRVKNIYQPLPHNTVDDKEKRTKIIRV